MTTYKLTWLADNDTFTADDAVACFTKANKWAGWAPGTASQTGNWADGVFHGGFPADEDIAGRDTRFTIETIEA